jgi:RimJ/RimL family protein N-acetyltransferase
LALTKHTLLAALPLHEGQLTIRQWTRADLDLLGAWPDYAFPYQGMEFSFRGKSALEKEQCFQARQDNPDTIVLVADHTQAAAIGYLALLRIDWQARIIGNFGLRVHPAWCDQGIGTAMLRAVSRWSFERGVAAVRVDVAASNTRAVCCYEKVGFVRSGELWRDAADLQGVDLSTDRYAFLRPHVRLEEELPRLRFLLMEVARST